jgi:hypothetical protein
MSILQHLVAKFKMKMRVKIIFSDRTKIRALQGCVSSSLDDLWVFRVKKLPMNCVIFDKE